MLLIKKVNANNIFVVRISLTQYALTHQFIAFKPIMPD